MMSDDSEALIEAFQASDAGILIFDTRDELQRFNPAAEAAWPGLSIGQPLSDFLPTNLGSDTWVREDRRAVPPQRQVFRRAGRVLFIRDETALLQAQLETSRVLNMAAHELRNPIATILGFADILKDPAVEPDQAETYLGYIHSKASRMNDLIDTLLDLSRSELGKAIPLRLVALPPTGLAESVWPTVTEEHPEACLETEFEPGTLLVDKKKFLKILTALLDNAVRFGSDTVRVKVAGQRAPLESGEPGFQITITDNGPGIPAELQTAVFEKYTAFDAPNGRPKGPGLGLTMVAVVTRAMGGSLKLISQTGRGTTIQLLFPAGD